MIAERALVALLTGDAAVTALVGNRIRAHDDAQNLASPYVTYRRVGTQEVGRSFDGPAPFRACLMQIDCWADDQSTASAPRQVLDLAQKVRVALDDKGGVFNGGAVTAIVFEDQRSLPEAGWQHVSLDFTFYEEG